MNSGICRWRVPRILPFKHSSKTMMGWSNLKFKAILRCGSFASIQRFLHRALLLIRSRSGFEMFYRPFEIEKFSSGKLNGSINNGQRKAWRIDDRKTVRTVFQQTCFLHPSPVFAVRGIPRLCLHVSDTWYIQRERGVFALSDALYVKREGTLVYQMACPVAHEACREVILCSNRPWQKSKGSVIM